MWLGFWPTLQARDRDRADPREREKGRDLASLRGWQSGWDVTLESAGKPQLAPQENEVFVFLPLWGL